MRHAVILLIALVCAAVFAGCGDSTTAPNADSESPAVIGSVGSAFAKAGTSGDSTTLLPADDTVPLPDTSGTYVPPPPPTRPEKPSTPTTWGKIKQQY